MRMRFELWIRITACKKVVYQFIYQTIFLKKSYQFACNCSMCDVDDDGQGIGVRTFSEIMHYAEIYQNVIHAGGNLSRHVELGSPSSHPS